MRVLRFFFFFFVADYFSFALIAWDHINALLIYFFALLCSFALLGAGVVGLLAAMLC